MTLALILVAGLACAMLFLLLLQRKEIHGIIAQLRERDGRESNTLLHSTVGMADELIRTINLQLETISADRRGYRQKSHALEKMMTNLSHDLLTPLTSALGYMDLIQRADLPEEEKRRELAIVENRLRRLEELIGSFFELYQVVSGGKEPEKEVFDLRSVLEEAIAHYYDEYCEQDRRILLDCPQGKTPCYANRNMLLRVFDNVIGNALKHGTGDLTVTLRAGDSIRITFENKTLTPEMDVERIFDEFYTTDISRTSGSSGLGLAIAREFTALLGGKMTASLHGDRFVLEMGWNQ